MDEESVTRTTYSQLLVLDVMSRAVFQDEEASLSELWTLFEDPTIEGAPIVSRDGDLVGVVAPIDLPGENDSRRLLTAHDVMEPVELRVRKSWPVAQAALAIDQYPLSEALPVFEDHSDAVVGLVSRTSLHPKRERGSIRGPRESDRPARFADRTVRGPLVHAG
ncbi:MAG: CBS domain-containing protein [Deltaproteobacteria bacterium]|nr:CBS domain-containing protein [Deltaproteobacteria bacterium]